MCYFYATATNDLLHIQKLRPPNNVLLRLKEGMILSVGWLSAKLLGEGGGWGGGGGGSRALFLLRLALISLMFLHAQLQGQAVIEKDNTNRTSEFEVF